jgi:hypothetical protein
MEFVEGETLERLIEKPIASPSRLIRVAIL